jgi:hypothetical protein
MAGIGNMISGLLLGHNVSRILDFINHYATCRTLLNLLGVLKRDGGASFTFIDI